MSTFATTGDLETKLQRTFDSSEHAAAELALRVATSLIQGYTGQHLFHVEDDEVVLLPKSHLVLLPQLPVTGVTTVTSDDDPVSWVLRPAGVLRLTGPWSELVRVTYSHGYEAIPDAIRGACLQIATRVVSHPLSVRQETSGPFSVTYSSDASPAGGLSAGEQQLLAPYKFSRLV